MFARQDSISFWFNFLSPQLGNYKITNSPMEKSRDGGNHAKDFHEVGQI